MRVKLSWWVPLLLLGGCSWSWLPFVGGDAEKDRADGKPAELVKITAELQIKQLWRKRVGDGLGKKYLRLQPAVVADQVVVADAYGKVEAFDRFGGKRLWSSSIGSINTGFMHTGIIDRRDRAFVTGGVGQGGGMIMLGTTLGEVVTLDAADGTERWRARVGSEILSAPVFGEDLVFAQTIDGRLLALEADTGAVRWSFDNQVPILTLRGTSAPVYQDGVVISGFASGKVSAVRASNGEPVWEHRIMLPEGRSELDRIVDVDSRPLVVGQSLYAVAFQGRVKSLRLADGSPFWEKKYSSFLDMASGYGQLYLVDAEDNLVAIDLESTDEAWRVDQLFKRKLSPPVAYSNYVIVGDEEGYLHVIAQSDGRFLARKKIDSKGIRSALVVADQVIYVVGNSGTITALELLEK